MLSSSITIAALLSVSWQPTGIVWEGPRQSTPQAVSYCISANGTNTSLTSAAQRQAVLDGINVWVATGSGGSLACTSYRAVASSQQCRVGVDLFDQRPNIFWERNWDQGSRTIGVTWPLPGTRRCGQITDDTGRRYNLQCKFDSDIELNDVNFRWSDTGRNNTVDIRSIVAHEYGHFIGLDHCDNNNTCQLGTGVMYSQYAGGTLRTPLADDVQGACALYPGNQGGIGFPCTRDAECMSNLCLTVGSDRYCSQTCGTCPMGFRCGTDPNNPNRQVCLRDNGLNRDVCEPCISGAADACISNGICVAGIPEQNQGRCVQPCEANGSCDDPQFRCLQVQFQNGGTGDYCFPRSSDCTDLSNFTVLQLGQRCDGDPPCADDLTCVGICAAECTGGVPCPGGYGCELFQGGRSFCLPLADEGESCEGLVSCSTGPCVSNPATGQFQCYRDCAGNPGACNNAQSCNTIAIGGGQTVTVCEPPGVPPLPPDAGFIFPDAAPEDTGGVVGPDTGADAGVGGPPDLGVPTPCGCDLTFNCDEDPLNPGTACSCDPECNCACDITFACDIDGTGNACSCDPECNCACDLTTACDPNCPCDPECYLADAPRGCTCTAPPAGPPWLVLLLGLAILTPWWRRRVA